MRDDEISEHCLCDKCAGHECGADNPEEKANEEKRAREARDNQMREEGAKAEREKIYKRLESLSYMIWRSPQSFGQKQVVNWSDIDCLFAELRSPVQKQPSTAVEDITPEGAAIVQKYKEQIRKDTIWEVLKHLKFNCPGGGVTPICDMCGANPYCIELRSPGQHHEREPE